MSDHNQTHKNTLSIELGTVDASILNNTIKNEVDLRAAHFFTSAVYSTDGLQPTSYTVFEEDDKIILKYFFSSKKNFSSFELDQIHKAYNEKLHRFEIKIEKEALVLLIFFYKETHDPHQQKFILTTKITFKRLFEPVSIKRESSNHDCSQKFSKLEK